jgi:hypothetical protein
MTAPLDTWCFTALTPLCDNCGERHLDARLDPNDPDDCDPGCDWNMLAGTAGPRCPSCSNLNPNCDDEFHEPRHPADNPRFLTSDRIGFSVSA